jgi:hypothetical protein
MDWDRIPAGRWGLRPLGLVLLLAAYAAARHLIAIGYGPHGDAPPIVYVLALVAFLCASVGGALLVHGHHLLDRIEISERWKRLPTTAPDSGYAEERESLFGH